MKTSSNRLSFVALLMGALALAFAILPSFVLPMTHPPAPLPDRVVSLAQQFKERTLAIAKGNEYQAPVTSNSERARWALRTSLVAAGAGLLAIVIAAFAYARDESPKASLTAAAMGGIAILLANMIGVATGLLALMIFRGWMTVG